MVCISCFLNGIGNHEVTYFFFVNSNDFPYQLASKGKAFEYCCIFLIQHWRKYKALSLKSIVFS